MNYKKFVNKLALKLKHFVFIVLCVNLTFLTSKLLLATDLMKKKAIFKEFFKLNFRKFKIFVWYFIIS